MTRPANAVGCLTEPQQIGLEHIALLLTKGGRVSPAFTSLNCASTP